MDVGKRVKTLGDRLRVVAADFSHDLNERYFLVHAALLRLLREDPDLMRLPKTPHDLRGAIDAVV
jgi:hypothetical protein